MFIPIDYKTIETYFRKGHPFLRCVKYKYIKRQNNK